MKKVLAVLLVTVLLVPCVAMAQDEAKAAAAPVKKAVKAYSGERIYLSSDMKTASFKKDGIHVWKHDLYYSCFINMTHRRRPGVCPKHKTPLEPSIKHGSAWYRLARDAQGVIHVQAIDEEPTIPAAVLTPEPNPACGDKTCCGGTDPNCPCCGTAACPDGTCGN